MNITHSGFVALVGRPNVGKSTLLNAMVGEKLAIVSAKPQTTRNRITGVLTRGETQMVFLDTPGLHRPKTRLGEYMVKTVRESIADVDAAILVVEPKAQAGEAETDLLENLRGAGLPVLLAVNKTDTVAHKEELMAVIAAWSARLPFTAVVPVSASRGEGVQELLDETASLLPEGPAYYPEDQYTTEPERAIVAEIIREKLLTLLSEEVPHGTAVAVERMRERESGDLVDIEAVIYCEKESHKGIIIGKGGRMLREVGTRARADIERLLGCHANLKLWVKVRDDWRNRTNLLKTLGYD
jgi:GTP-binding protein Era